MWAYCGRKKKKKEQGLMAGLPCRQNVMFPPTLGMNGSTPALLLFLNSVTPAVMYCRTCWRAQEAREKGAQETCVET